MVLECLKHTIRKQDWFAVSLEVIIVIAGIIIGFRITAWGNEQTSRAQERELLRGLRAEFVANIALYDQTATEHRRSVEQAKQMLSWTGPDPVRVGI